jgi:hypothetical protein
VVRSRDQVSGIPREDRRARAKTLKHLFELFRDTDPEREIRRLKSEDTGF